MLNSGKGEILIYGDISNQKYWEDDVTPKDIIEQLQKLKGVSSVDLRINSYGGDCFAGDAIINLIQKFKDENNCLVDVFIDGIAASMGSNIAMVGDTITMADNTLMMLHKPLTMVGGNANDFEKAIEMLNKVEKTIIANYKRHFTGDEQELIEMLEKETWLTAQEAYDCGLCTNISSSVKMVASAKGIGEFVTINGVEYGKTIVDIINDKKLVIEEMEENQKMTLVYNDKMKNFGITEEVFNSFVEPQEVIDKMCSLTIPEPVENFITKEQAVDCLGEKVTAEQVLESAKAYHDCKEQNDINAKKSKSYDQLVQNEISETVKMGIKAKGDAFNSERWTKILNTFSYDEIIDQKKEFEEEAKVVFNAGKQVSEPMGKVVNGAKPIEFIKKVGK